MSLNADLIRQRCAEIEESVSRLERVKALPRKDVLANQDTLDIGGMFRHARRGGDHFA